MQAKRERGRDPGSDVGAKKPRLEEPKEETPAPAALTQAAMPEEAQVQEAAQPAQLPAAQQPAPEVGCSLIWLWELCKAIAECCSCVTDARYDMHAALSRCWHGFSLCKRNAAHYAALYKMVSSL